MRDIIVKEKLDQVENTKTSYNFHWIINEDSNFNQMRSFLIKKVNYERMFDKSRSNKQSSNDSKSTKPMSPQYNAHIQ